MSEPQSITLFGLSRSVYTRIARLALEEKQATYQLQEVEIFSEQGVPESHLNRHPFGRIPVLSHGGFLIYETAAITRYIDEALPGIQLQPSDVKTRAHMAQIIGVLDSYAYRPMVWSIFVQRLRVPADGGHSNEAEISQGVERSRECLRVLELLQGEQPFLAGPEFSLADLHAYPILCYLALTDEGAELISGFPRQADWMERISSRPSITQTRTVYE